VPTVVTALVALAELRFSPLTILRWIFTRLLLLLLVINGVMYLKQPQLTFYPYAELEGDPAQWGMKHEEVMLTTTDGVRLHGWYLPHPAATKTLLFLHGNGGNISHRLDSLKIFNGLGLNVLIIDYRGYGRSEGTPSEEGLYRDAEAAWDYLIKVRGIEARQIVIFGRSLGGAVATELAARVKPAALILESTFSSARDAARALFPRLSYLVLLRYSFNSGEKIRRVGSPILILHSRQDELIPYSLGRALYESAPEPKRFVELKGGHNDGFVLSQPDYERSLSAFLQELNQN